MFAGLINAENFPPSILSSPDSPLHSEDVNGGGALNIKISA